MTKVYNAWAEIVQGVVFYHTREWSNIWKKTDLWFGKWIEEFGKFPLEHTKVWKLELSLGPFTQSWKCMILKFTGELCSMTMKNDAKFEKEWPVSSKLT